jgi:hypothetical protein
LRLKAIIYFYDKEGSGWRRERRFKKEIEKKKKGIRSFQINEHAFWRIRMEVG